jgi:hypothetical protein
MRLGPARFPQPFSTQQEVACCGAPTSAEPTKEDYGVRELAPALPYASLLAASRLWRGAEESGSELPHSKAPEFVGASGDVYENKEGRKGTRPPTSALAADEGYGVRERARGLAPGGARRKAAASCRTQSH